MSGESPRLRWPRPLGRQTAKSMTITTIMTMVLSTISAVISIVIVVVVLLLLIPGTANRFNAFFQNMIDLKQ